MSFDIVKTLTKNVIANILNALIFTAPPNPIPDQSIDTFENESILLNCTKTGNPTPTYEWFKDG